MENIIKNSGLIKYGDRIVVGVSGGPDSICLLNALANLRDEFSLALFVVHINHMLREEADFEENFVKELCQKLKIKFFSKKADIATLAKNEKKSEEEVARKVRYDFFNQILKEKNADKIAVAHNANDNAETFLLNLVRGSGLEGLCGISERNGNIIRPLITVSRDEIEKYIEENNLTVMRDKTNSNTVYTRNKIRNIIIPELKEINPNIINTINRTVEILTSENKLLKELVEKKYDETEYEGKIKKNAFLELSRPLKRAVLRRKIQDYKGNLTDISFKNIENAINIIDNSQSGSIIKLSDNMKLEISYNEIRFCDNECTEFNYELEIPGVTHIKETGKKITAKISEAKDVPEKFTDKNKCFFDIDKTGKKLYVRSKLEGDKFSPTGMNGTKSLKRFFSDLKIDSNDRKKIPLITNDEDIIWIAGLRSSGKYLKDKNTKEVIILEYGEDI